MVDPVDVLFREYFAQFLAEPFGRFEIGPERFFDDDPAPSAFPFRYIQSAFEKTLRDHRIHGGRRGQIVEYPIRQTQFPPEPDDTLRKLWVGRRIGRQVIDFPEKFVRAVALQYLTARPSERDVGKIASRGTQNREAVRQQPSREKLGKGRQQLTGGQIARSTENDQQLVV